MKPFPRTGIVLASLALPMLTGGQFGGSALGQVCEPAWDAVSIDQACECYNGRFNYQITSFTELDGTLVAGGGFGALAGSCPAIHNCSDVDTVAIWSGTAFVPFAPDTDCHSLAGVVNAVAEFQDELYVGGSWDVCACAAASGPPLGGCGCGGGCLNGLGHCEVAGDDDCDSSCIRGSIARWNESFGDWEAVGGDLNNGMGCGLENSGATAQVLSMFVWDDQRGGGEALYVGGYFSHTRGGLVELQNVGKWDGTRWTPLGRGINVTGCCTKHPPRAFASMTDCVTGLPLLYVAAHGTAINTNGSQVLLKGVGVWNGQTWSALPPIPGVGTVSALAVFDDGSGPALYAGGNFENQQSGIINIARWSGTQWQPLGGGVWVDCDVYNVGSVKTMSVFYDGSGPALYVGGSFNEAGGDWWGWADPGSPPGDCWVQGVDAINIARWDGQDWSDVEGWSDGPVLLAMRRFDRAATPELFVGGWFPDYGGEGTTGNVAVWSGCLNADTCPGSTLPGADPSADCNANSIPDICETDHDCNGNFVPDECEGSGDFDFDCFRDLTDYNAFWSCFAGPGEPYPDPPGLDCIYLDMDRDYDVDFADFAIFQNLFFTVPPYCCAPAGPCAGGFQPLTVSSNDSCGSTVSVLPNARFADEVNVTEPETFYYTGGSNVALELLGAVPATFAYWRIDGVPQAPGVVTAAVTVDAGRTAEAVFVNTIVSSNPPDGAIDARQPHALSNPQQRYGWDTVTLTFAAPVCGLSPADFSVSVTAGTAPVITEVAGTAAGNVILHLDQPIPAGAWTTFTHLTSGGSICLGYLPADANSDGTSGPIDILTIIDNLNGVIQPPLQLRQCDTDRSGLCTPADILAVIDLLNGAGAFDSWLYATLPASPCTGALPCVQCAAPQAAGVGPRYLSMTPPAGPYPLSLVVTCPGGIDRYVGVPGGSGHVAYLTDNPAAAAFLTPAQWAGPVYVTGEFVAPWTEFQVRADFGLGSTVGRSPPATAKTWWRSDTNHSYVPGGAIEPNVLDIVAVVDAFKGRYPPNGPATLYSVDQVGTLNWCRPDMVINVLDIVTVVDAFKGLPYTCPNPCVGGGGGASAAAVTDAAAQLRLTASATSIYAGGTVYVRAFVDHLSYGLKAYEVAVEVIGGTAGTLTLEEVTVETTRPDYAFAGQSVVTAGDAASSRGATTLQNGALPLPPSAYLATYRFRASSDARGIFTVRARPADTQLIESIERRVLPGSLGTVSVTIRTISGGGTKDPITQVQ